MAQRRRALPSKWSAAENERLRRAVKLHGEPQWKLIAVTVGTRNHSQCLHRWRTVLRPGLAKGPWTAAEDEMLTNLVRQGDISNWGDVAAVITTRTCKQWPRAVAAPPESR
ncbi:hypothetical protein JKP88DRAFT_166320 [Tribonema minus]|uniref:Uncharacterized protein n=1 Tax=Tribonema minus TaxID=303371 RepID=A0A835YSE1_9STRA|nr:hypothetical protein JKP88DRAFT_166320 [Tribonema minus]